MLGPRQRANDDIHQSHCGTLARYRPDEDIEDAPEDALEDALEAELRLIWWWWCCGQREEWSVCATERGLACICVHLHAFCSLERVKGNTNVFVLIKTAAVARSIVLLVNKPTPSMGEHRLPRAGPIDTLEGRKSGCIPCLLRRREVVEESGDGGVTWSDRSRIRGQRFDIRAVFTNIGRAAVFLDRSLA